MRGERKRVDEKKKSRIKSILLYSGLALVIAFTVITSIVLNYKQNQLNDLKDKNEEMDKVLGDDETDAFIKDFEIFSKNLNNFIDKASNV